MNELIALLNMTFKYQLGFLGDTTNSAYDAIRSRFYEKIKDMGLPKDAFIDLYASNFVTDYQNKQPSFVYYFGKKDHNDKDADLLKTLMSNGDAIMPVFFHQESFLEEIPDQVSKMNGKLYSADKVDDFVNYALEALWLMRQNRKLFISYRRNDSTGIANQLFDKLVRCNYDVFLDAYSIGPGRNFQDELHHRLSDCDILIQLYSKRFMESPWCREEITAANQKQIGVIELVWPGLKLDMHNHLCAPVKLEENDFTTNSADPYSKLTNDTIVSIARKVESVRARNMAARQDSLIGEFIKEAQNVGRLLIQEYKYLVERKEENDTNVFIPAVGVPQSFDCYESLFFKELLQNPKTKIFLIYDDLRIKKKWIEHLDWLNNSLEVKTIKKKEFATWLRNN